MMDYFLFDLDGTITMEELLPRIATQVGVKEQIQKLTQKTIAGEIPFEYSLKHRLEILNIVAKAIIIRPTIKNILAKVRMISQLLVTT